MLKRTVVVLYRNVQRGLDISLHIFTLSVETNSVVMEIYFSLAATC